MRKGYLIVPVLVFTGIMMCNFEGGEEPEPYRIPKESTYVGAVIFSEGPTLVGADIEDGEQVKRVGGRYILRINEDFLVIEVYSWGARALFKKELYSISELQQEYPEGVSIWIEQDAASATVVLVPWQ